jgi:hypothetical protein
MFFHKFRFQKPEVRALHAMCLVGFASYPQGWLRIHMGLQRHFGGNDNIEGFEDLENDRSVTERGKKEPQKGKL